MKQSNDQLVSAKDRFKISVIDIRSGYRFTLTADDKMTAIKKAQNHEDKHYVHVYDTHKKEDEDARKNNRVYTNAPKVT